MIKNRKAFTLTELMIAVVLMGVIAGFGIPSYNKARDKALEKEAVHNLRMIQSALELYYIRNDNTYPDLPDVDAINTTLNLGIIEGGSGYYMSYSCTTGPPTNVACSALHHFPGGGIDWFLIFLLSNNSLNYFTCPAGNCPSCPGCTYPETF